MLTNKQIHTLLKQQRKITAFAKFLGESKQLIGYRLKSEKPMNRLEGEYKRFAKKHK